MYLISLNTLALILPVISAAVAASDQAPEDVTGHQPAQSVNEQLCTVNGISIIDCRTTGCMPDQHCAPDCFCHQNELPENIGACKTGWHWNQALQVCSNDGIKGNAPSTEHSDCHVDGCHPPYVCKDNGVCHLGKPPVLHKTCSDGTKYWPPPIDDCLPITRLALPRSEATALPQATESPALSVEAVCHINSNGTARCCSEKNGICVNGETEKGSEHVIVPTKDEL